MANDRVTQREIMGFNKLTLDCQGKKIKLEEGMRKNECFYARWYDEGHVLYDFYILDTTAVDNHLYVLKCDTLNKRIEGTFNATFKIVEPREDPSNPMILKFTSGKFWATIRR